MSCHHLKEKEPVDSLGLLGQHCSMKVFYQVYQNTHILPEGSEVKGQPVKNFSSRLKVLIIYMLLREEVKDEARDANIVETGLRRAPYKTTVAVFF